MGRKCCVPFCRSGYKSTQHQYFDDRIAVFQFPSDTEQRNKWIEAIPRSNWTPSPHSGVCEKHFIEADFIIHSVDKNNFRAAKKNLMNRRLYRKRISPTAIPTIFPTPESLVRRVRRSKSDLDIKGEDDDDSLFCVVPHCKLAYGTMGNYPPGLGHYLFPEDLDLRQKWYDAIPKSEWNSSEDARVCSLHFDEHDYIGETKTMGPLTVGELREDAIPHIFPRIASEMRSTRSRSRKKKNAYKDDDEDYEEEEDYVKDPLKSAYRSREVREGTYDLNSFKPWRLDFDTIDRDTPYWLWEQKWRTFYRFTGLNVHEDEYKIATLRSFLSDSAIEVMDSFNLPDPQANDVEHVLTALRIHAAKQMSVVNARMRFNMRQQEDDEQFDAYLVELLSLSKSCEFCEGCRDGLIRDRIMVGLKDSSVINKMLRMPELNLQQAINFCRAEEKKKNFPNSDDPFFSTNISNVDQSGWHDVDDADDTPPSAPQPKKRKFEVKDEPDLSDGDDNSFSASFSEQGQSGNNGGVNQDPSQMYPEEKVLVTMAEGEIVNTVPIYSDANDDDLNQDSGDEMSVKVKSEFPNQKEGKRKQQQPVRYTPQTRQKQTFDDYLAEMGLDNFGVKDRFMCHLCPEEFVTSTRLLNHIKSDHEGPPRVPKKVTGGKCKFCNEEFKLMKHLNKHIAEVHKEYKPYVCKICPARFNHRGHLTRHTQILHENERRFICDLCPKRFGTRECLLSHKKNIHDGQRCDICNNIFTNRRELRHHLNVAHPSEKPHLCEGCGKSFGNQAILNTHIKRVHTDKATDKPHMCEACGSGFSQLHFLMYHIRKMRRRGCELHQKMSASNGYDIPEFDEEAMLEAKHWEESAPRCKLCSVSFTSIHSLKSHLSTVHAKEKKYECGVCLKRFTTQNILTSHTQNIHLGMKPYDCPHCSAKFGQRTHRNRHVRVVHEGLKEHVCDICGKKYANKIDLHNHLKKVHNQEISFNCPHCGMRFEKKKFLIHHLETVHENMAQMVTINPIPPTNPGQSMPPMQQQQQPMH